MKQRHDLMEIRESFITTLKEKGVEAKPAHFDEFTIDTIGIWENALERSIQSTFNDN